MVRCCATRPSLREIITTQYTVQQYLVYCTWIAAFELELIFPLGKEFACVRLAVVASGHSKLCYDLVYIHNRTDEALRLYAYGGIEQYTHTPVERDALCTPTGSGREGDLSVHQRNKGHRLHHATGSRLLGQCSLSLLFHWPSVFRENGTLVVLLAGVV